MGTVNQCLNLLILEEIFRRTFTKRERNYKLIIPAPIRHLAS